MSAEIRIASTKKLHPNQKQFLLNAGISVVEADFIKIKNKTFLLTNIQENLIFTSQNAVKSVLENKEAEILKDKDCYCVGIKTKALLEQNNFKVVLCELYGSHLAKKIVSIYPQRSFTFFSGSIRLDEIPSALKHAAISFNEIEVYETLLAPVTLNVNFDGILFFSPSAVESFFRKNSINNQICFCIGETTAAAARQFTKNIVIANQPTIESTIAKCINYYKV